MSVSGKKCLDPETDIMDQFLDPETDIKHQFLNPETDKKCQFLEGCPKTDVMDQFLDPETDIMGEGNYILMYGLRLCLFCLLVEHAHKIPEHSLMAKQTILKRTCSNNIF